jgi:hypothetical protein
MKNLLIAFACVCTTCSALGQEKFSVPEIPVTAKHQQVVFQFYSIFGGSVQFAKTQGVSPYEFGQYLGELFAPTWNEEAGFEGFVNGSIYIWESFNTVEDGSVSVDESDDGSVVVKVPIQSRKRYLTGEPSFMSFEDLHLCMQGLMEPIAEHLGVTFSQEVAEDAVIYKFHRK